MDTTTNNWSAASLNRVMNEGDEPCHPRGEHHHHQQQQLLHQPVEPDDALMEFEEFLFDALFTDMDTNPPPNFTDNNAVASFVGLPLPPPPPPLPPVPTATMAAIPTAIVNGSSSSSSPPSQDTSVARISTEVDAVAIYLSEDGNGSVSVSSSSSSSTQLQQQQHQQSQQQPPMPGVVEIDDNLKESCVLLGGGNLGPPSIPKLVWIELQKKYHSKRKKAEIKQINRTKTVVWENVLCNRELIENFWMEFVNEMILKGIPFKILILVRDCKKNGKDSTSSRIDDNITTVYRLYNKSRSSYREFREACIMPWWQQNPNHIRPVEPEIVQRDHNLVYTNGGGRRYYKKCAFKMFLDETDNTPRVSYDLTKMFEFANALRSNRIDNYFTGKRYDHANELVRSLNDHDNANSQRSKTGIEKEMKKLWGKLGNPTLTPSSPSSTNADDGRHDGGRGDDDQGPDCAKSMKRPHTEASNQLATRPEKKRKAPPKKTIASVEDEKMDRKSAVILIQAFVRMVLAKKKVVELKKRMKCKKRMGKKVKKSAIRIQSVVRGFLQRLKRNKQRLEREQIFLDLQTYLLVDPIDWSVIPSDGQCKPDPLHHRRRDDDDDNDPNGEEGGPGLGPSSRGMNTSSPTASKSVNAKTSGGGNSQSRSTRSNANTSSDAKSARCSRHPPGGGNVHYGRMSRSNLMLLSDVSDFVRSFSSVWHATQSSNLQHPHGAHAYTIPCIEPVTSSNCRSGLQPRVTTSTTHRLGATMDDTMDDTLFAFYNEYEKSRPITNCYRGVEAVGSPTMIHYRKYLQQLIMANRSSIKNGSMVQISPDVSCRIKELLVQKIRNPASRIIEKLKNDEDSRSCYTGLDGTDVFYTVSLLAAMGATESDIVQRFKAAVDPIENSDEKIRELVLEQPSTVPYNLPPIIGALNGLTGLYLKNCIKFPLQMSLLTHLTCLVLECSDGEFNGLPPNLQLPSLRTVRVLGSVNPTILELLDVKTSPNLHDVEFSKLSTTSSMMVKRFLEEAFGVSKTANIVAPPLSSSSSVDVTINHAPDICRSSINHRLLESAYPPINGNTIIFNNELDSSHLGERIRLSRAICTVKMSDDTDLSNNETIFRQSVLCADGHSDKHKELRKMIGSIASVEGLIQFYRTNHLFHESLELVRSSANAYAEHKKKQKNDSGDSALFLDQWSKEWAEALRNGEQWAYRLELCRRTSFSFVYRAFDLCEKERISMFSDDCLGERVIRSMLYYLLPMDRSNALYGLRDTRTNQIGLGWYCTYQEDEYKKLYGETNMKPTMNRRLYELLDGTSLGDEFQNWLKPSCPPRLTTAACA